MSFILDALKKSETDRQQQGSAEFAGVPTSRNATRVPGWLWIVGLLLAVNLAVLLGLLFKPTALPPQPPAAVSEARVAANGTSETRNEINPAPASPAIAGSFAAQVAAAKERNPAPREPSSAEGETAEAAQTAAPVTARPPITRNTAALPTLQEVQANGTVNLPELHLDIHVYSAAPADRFVFINMSKQRERSSLAEGPMVKEITPDGVVLEHQGTTFLLPRE